MIFINHTIRDCEFHHMDYRLTMTAGEYIITNRHMGGSNSTFIICPLPAAVALFINACDTLLAGDSVAVAVGAVIGALLLLYYCYCCCC